jgi:hypothetical protein
MRLPHILAKTLCPIRLSVGHKILNLVRRVRLPHGVPFRLLAHGVMVAQATFSSRNRRSYEGAIPSLTRLVMVRIHVSQPE